MNAQEALQMFRDQIAVYGEAAELLEAIATLAACVEAAEYFDYASNPYNDYENKGDGEYVTITVTVGAIRDCRAALKGEVCQEL